MLNQRKKVLVWGVLALAGIWVVAMTGWWISNGMRVTAEKVRTYVSSVDLSKLSGDERAKAIQRLEEMLNRLSPEERQRMRLGRTADDWFRLMTEEEKAQFIEATMPTGFKQMISAFEEMPEDKRKRAIDDAMKRLRELNTEGGARKGNAGTNGPAPLSPELEAKVRTIGLKTFYGQSSAQTKAELAPVLEELQRAMESGRMNRR